MEAMAEKAAQVEAPVRAGPPKTPLILALVNTLAVMGALGFLIYTKVLFKRPSITETGERERLAELKAKPPAATAPGLISFDATTVNIQPTQVSPTEASGDSTRMKLHYVTFEFSLEVNDLSRKEEVEELRPRIMDRLLSMMGRKTFAELTTVQGRYLLRSQIGEIVNALTSSEDGSSAPLVTNVFFKQFIVQ
jgi:flagellar basal body-associated protein FliL